jgi:hypothetical protein
LFHDTELHEHEGPPSDLTTLMSTAKKVEPASWWMLRGGEV